MVDWRSIPYSMGGNDTVGDCTIVDMANIIDVWNARRGQLAPVETEECIRMYMDATGYRRDEPGTDKGAVLEQVLDYWIANGWRADPLLTPKSRWPIRVDEIAESCVKWGAVATAAMLPQDEYGNPDFTDVALRQNASGMLGHAMTAVHMDGDSLVLVTWQRLQPVSLEWWERYGMTQQEVVPPDWIVAEWKE